MEPMKIPCNEITIQGNKTLMSAELAHQKADNHLCVALHRKVRIRGYTLLWKFIAVLQAIRWLFPYHFNQVEIHVSCF